MRIIVTGGSGLIGTAFISFLLERGHQVWNLTRRPRPEAAKPGLKQVTWDGYSAQGWQHLVEQADAIVNLAGENLSRGLWTKKRKQLIRISRVKAGQAIVAAVQQSAHKPQVILQASGINYYDSSTDEPATESSPPGSGFLASVCLDWEASTQPVEDLGIRRVILRTALVLAPNGGTLPLMALPFRLFLGGPIGGGQQWYSWISLQDQVSAMYFLMKNDHAHGAFNLSAPQPLRMAEFGRVLAKALHRPYWFPTPGFVLRWVLGEMSSLVLEGRPVLPERLQALGYQFQHPDLSQALAEILHP